MNSGLFVFISNATCPFQRNSKNSETGFDPIQVQDLLRAVLQHFLLAKCSSPVRSKCNCTEINQGFGNACDRSPEHEIEKMFTFFHRKIIKFVFFPNWVACSFVIYDNLNLIMNIFCIISKCFSVCSWMSFKILGLRTWVLPPGLSLHIEINNFKIMRYTACVFIIFTGLRIALDPLVISLVLWVTCFQIMMSICCLWSSEEFDVLSRRISIPSHYGFRRKVISIKALQNPKTNRHNTHWGTRFKDSTLHHCSGVLYVEM